MWATAGQGAERNSRPDGGSSLACSALNARRCTKRTMSDDGTKIVYSSAADNLVDGDSNGRADVFLTTVNPGQPPTPPTAGSGGSPADPGIPPSVISTVRISVGPGGVQGDGNSVGASISPDGHWIAFESAATNFGPDGNGGTVDVFVYHVDDESLRLASVSTSGGGGDGHSFGASVANNGTVSFTSLAGNLVPGAGGQQVYARSDATELVSSATGGAAGDGRSGESVISGDGTTVAFTSESTNLGSGHAKGDDIFVHKLGGATTMLTSAAKAYLPSISADGQKLVFIAEGYDNDGIGDIYQSATEGGAKPTIYANCPCRSRRRRGPHLGHHRQRRGDAVLLGGAVLPQQPLPRPAGVHSQPRPGHRQRATTTWSPTARPSSPRSAPTAPSSPSSPWPTT